jgi:hypothetical protein
VKQTLAFLFRILKKKYCFEQLPKEVLGTQYVGFEVFTAVTIKNAVFWDVAQCGSVLTHHIPEDGILR